MLIMPTYYCALLCIGWHGDSHQPICGDNAYETLKLYEATPSIPNFVIVIIIFILL